MIKKIFKYLDIEMSPAERGGYTIIETMIAVSLFLVVVMTGMGALLNANLLHLKSQDSRSIMDNLSFVLEDMSRNLRTGYDYHCVALGQGLNPETLDEPKSCALGWAVAFEATGGDITTDIDQWVYYISTDGKILKSTDGASSFIELTPVEVVIDQASGFSVLGAEPPPVNAQQPFIILKLKGSITTKNVESPFSVQTGISQRLLDI